MDTLFLSALVPEPCDHPERRTTYYMSYIAGNLQRDGSQPRAESNHSGIHAHFGMGSQEIEHHKTCLSG
jgi:hypothetical protein